MTDLTHVFTLAVAVAIGALCFFLLRSLFFRRGSMGNVPSTEEVKSVVEKLNETSQGIINQLMTKFTLRLSSEAFSTLCVATALAIEQPLARLEQKVVLSEFLDSLNNVEFALLLEELYEIEISDEDAERFLTFDDILRYVDSRLTSA